MRTEITAPVVNCLPRGNFQKYISVHQSRLWFCYSFNRYCSISSFIATALFFTVLTPPQVEPRVRITSGTDGHEPFWADRKMGCDSPTETWLIARVDHLAYVKIINYLYVDRTLQDRRSADARTSPRLGRFTSLPG